MNLEGEHLELDEEETEAMEKCGYTEEEALAFKGVYKHYDATFGKDDGKCTPALVKSMVRALGIQMQKKDEETLVVLLEECDENKDGSTQFPEFLLLIKKMQDINFCKMNEAAAERVESEKRAIDRKEKAESRKKKEKEAHRASLVVATEDQAAAIQAAAAEMEAKKKAKKDDDDSGEEGGALKEYDAKTDGPYQYFYWKHHKAALDEMQHTWKDYLEKVKAR
mmetsp:Transcript_14247/g.35353  ORF Transcript_14247/g.35353 Transcript_14247/m.35353 type:complete len:223 (+) Transcript_14247:222-890(+)|eukprot:CAMPEP_0179001728 /NCGR_PEP_ID=MMETSP0795-20121207/11545_1 /TAXON_ID=88552 /ORGANISM="Amoebophrya sp., Strain Ameob2" /LENGTH=222 /DNA_ID=CAMNT_0020695181 /DNA_START=170 /DNA_END=838 /DNA_ORIENTATION=-